MTTRQPMKLTENWGDVVIRREVPVIRRAAARSGLSRVCPVVQYAVLEAIRTVYGIWQI